MSVEKLSINTGIEGNLGKIILKCVIGQLSDGMWENSNTMGFYWPYVKIELNEKDEVCIVISLCKPWCNCFISKLEADPTKIMLWFADKIHRVVKEERKYHPERGIRFSSKCDVQLGYMDCKVNEAHAVYKALKDRCKARQEQLDKETDHAEH